VRARELGVHVIDRCNLTILEEPGQADSRSSSPRERTRTARLQDALLMAGEEDSSGLGVDTTRM